MPGDIRGRTWVIQVYAMRGRSQETAELVMDRRQVNQANLVIAIFGTVALVACSFERDRGEAVTVAARVHAEMRAGDFAALYKESAPRFKTVGSESEFVTWMKELQQEFGLLKNANEITYQTGLDSRIGRTHVLVFDLDYDRGRARESMTLVRSESGEMQLWKLAIQPVD
jgi:hypothetical protein